MTRSTIVIGIAVLSAGLLACGGSSQPAVPTLPPLGTSAAPNSQEQPAPVVQQSYGGAQNTASRPVQADEAMNMAAKLPQQLRGEEAPAPPWPTFTPGPRPQSDHRVVYARARRLYTASADGSTVQALKFENKSPQLLGTSFKDPGRGWLAANGRYLLYFAGREAQLWRADLQSLANVQLAERMIPMGKEDDAELMRILANQDVTWSSDGTRAALLGAPESMDVFIVDLATDHLTRVTQDELRERGLQWSPDGRYLAYVAGDPGTGAQALYILDTRTKQPAQVDMQPIRDALDLDPDAGFAFGEQLTWLSDAQLVFYPQAGRRGRLAGIWYYDTASRMVQPILTDQLEATTWSAEARAWVYSRSGEPGALWLVRLDDPKPTLLVEGQAYAPVWSPNGQLVLFSWSDPETTGWDLRVVDLGGNTRTLVRDALMIQREMSELGPAGKRYWSPNGELVLYTTVGRDYGRAERQGGYGGDAGPDLENWWIVQVNGGEPRQATDMQRIFYLQEPVLSPDGTSWAFIGFSYTDRLQHLYTMPRDGGHPEKVDVGVRWFEWLP